MYKVKLFSAATKDELQHITNEWLMMNKEILIHSSSLVVENMEAPLAKAYNFHVLYTVTAEQDSALKEMAAAVTHEQSVEVKEMNPEIMKPTS